MPNERVSVVLSAKDQASATVKSFSASLKSAAKDAFNLKNVLLGAGAAFAGREIVRGAASLVNAFKEQEQSVEGLNAALRQTGQLTEANSRLVQEQASALQRVTTAGDEQLIQVSTTVAQLAKELSAGELAQVQQAVIGISDALGVDLQSAAQLVGKTIGSQTNALSRYGIQVDTSASQSEKLAQIMEQSAGFFEVAKARTDTLAGAQQQFANAVGDLKEELGGVLVEVLNLRGGTGSLTDKVFQAIDVIKRNRDAIVAWGRVVTTSAKVFLEAGKAIIRAAFNLGQIVGDIFRGLGKLIVGVFTLDLGLVKEAISETKDAVAQDVGDIVAGFEGWADALLEVAAAAEAARTGSVEAAASTRTSMGGNLRLGAGGGVPRIAPMAPATTGVDPLALRGATLVPEVDIEPLLDVEAILRDAAAAAADFQGPMREAGQLTEQIGQVVSANMAAMVGAVDQGAAAVARSMVQMIAQIAAAAAGGPFGAVIGAIGGLISSAIGGGRGADPVPIRMSQIDDQAAAKIRPPGERGGVQKVTLVVTDRHGMAQQQYELKRRERRDAEERIPAGFVL